MANKKRNNKKQAGKNLSGTPAKAADKKKMLLGALKEGGLILVTAIAAGGVGAAIGRHSLLAGIPVAVFGAYKKNNYITAAGLGLVLSNGFQQKAAAQTTEGMGALDIKQVATEAKDRVATFFKNFSQKLYLPVSDQTTSGLGEDSQEEVTYFVNPYSNKELDMSAIDRIQEQIAQMSAGAPVNGAMGNMEMPGQSWEATDATEQEIDREF